MAEATIWGDGPCDGYRVTVSRDLRLTNQPRIQGPDNG